MSSFDIGVLTCSYYYRIYFVVLLPLLGMLLLYVYRVPQALGQTRGRHNNTQTELRLLIVANQITIFSKKFRRFVCIWLSAR
jgi:hypothetical protein